MQNLNGSFPISSGYFSDLALGKAYSCGGVLEGLQNAILDYKNIGLNGTFETFSIWDFLRGKRWSSRIIENALKSAL